MKKISILNFLFVVAANVLAQQAPGVKITPALTPPIKVYEKPQIKKQIVVPVEPKLTPLPSFSTILTTSNWIGDRTWYDNQAAHVDVVTDIKFDANGTCTWTKQGWEHVPTTSGTYTISGSSIEINFNYFPYTHKLVGVYDPTTKKITGKFTEERAKDPNAPMVHPPSGVPYTYVAGTIEGQFNFFIK
jgi:hypothetical protein